MALPFDPFAFDVGDVWKVLISVVFGLIGLWYRHKRLASDRHDLTGSSVRYLLPGDNQLSVSVKVVNSGKREVTVSFVSVEVAGGPKTSRAFTHQGGQHVAVGGSAVTSIEPGDVLHLWRSRLELDAASIFVEDALGKQYRAPLEPL